MAKMMFKNLNAIVANTLTDSIKMIDIDELHNSDDNFFDINRIEEFAETILGQGGVKDNLVVRPLDDGGYEIISGHRRKAAVQYLLDNGENISRYLPCLVQNYDNNDDKMLDIVLMNVSSRQISDSEMWKSYEIVDRILQNKKSAGEKFGRVRDKLAECLGISTSQVRKIQNIDNNAIEPVKDAISSGKISISTANEIARLDEDEQQEVMKSSPSKISHKDIKKMNDNKKVDTYVTFSEDNMTKPNSESDEVDFTKIYSKSDEKTKKVDTCVTFSEDDMTELDEKEESFTYDTFSEKEELSIDSDFSEDDMIEPDSESNEDDFAESYLKSNEKTKKVAAYGTFSEGDTAESYESTTEHTLADFIHEHYFDIESIFTAYISMTDNPDETELLEEFQKLLYQTKEAERNKARFRP